MRNIIKIITRKRIKITIWIVVLVNIILFAMPYFRSNETIRNDILKLMPIGTTWEEVVDIIGNKNKWYVPTSMGLIPFSSYFASHSSDTVSISNLYLSLEDYGHPFYYAFFAVDVILRFDKDLKLIEVEVRQYLSI
jgi:hypothetical protein